MNFQKVTRGKLHFKEFFILVDGTILQSTEPQGQGLEFFILSELLLFSNLLSLDKTCFKGPIIRLIRMIYRECLKKLFR